MLRLNQWDKNRPIVLSAYATHTIVAMISSQTIRDEIALINKSLV